MGLTKQYLRYVPAGTFNVIASPKCNSVFIVLDGQEGRFVAVGACEHIFIWDLRLGQKVQVLSGDKFEVTCLSASPNKRHLAAGYTDGTVQVFDLQSGEIVSIFSGHKSDVTTLVFDQFGHKLASGSKDTEIVVWDTVAEAGICRLSGHKNIVTQLVFMTESNVLISGSKDTFVKFWDLDSQYCFKTLVGHRTEVWGLTLMKQDRYLVTGCGDSELRVWKLVVKNDVKNKPPVDQLATNLEFTDLENGIEDDLNYPLQCHKTGSVLRSGRGRVVSICSDVSGQVLGCHGPDDQLELFIFYSDDDATARLKKRQRKERKKQKSTDENDESQTKESSQDLVLSLRDEVRRLPAVKLPQKPKSLDLILGGNGELRIVTVLSDNTLELYSLATLAKDEKASLLRSISGHKGEMRAVAVSSDGMAFASAGADSLKIWNRMSQVCLRTVETKGYALSVAFVPGDRHALIGMKDGRLVIADISAGDVLEEIPAHGEELWCICLTPDLRGCVTGGGDNTVKFWQFELISDPQEEIKAKVLSLLHTRTLKLEEKVLSVKISPNNKLVAVALLDSTVKIFFVDTFKFYLSLYGHKLPVLCMDISSDSTLIATGSADRNVKLWGLDFGDCHKSLFAHDDSVTALQFVPKTHYFFTCGRDGKVKEWDGDSYNKIITLQGHCGEVWTLAVSPDGRHVISAGADRALRLWQRTDEPLVLEDEEEEEREANERLITGEETVVAGRGVVTLPTRKTVGSEKAADSLLECLEVYTTYSEQLAEHCSSDEVVTQPQLPPIMQALQVNTVNDFLIETLKRIRSSDLEEALLLLPFTTACVLLRALADCAALGCEMELVARVVVFTLRLHAGSIHAAPDLVPTLRLLQKHVIGSINNLRDITGYNLYGLQYLQRELETQESVQLFRDATLTKKKQDNKRRQRDKLKRTLLTLSASWHTSAYTLMIFHHAKGSNYSKVVKTLSQSLDRLKIF